MGALEQYFVPGALFLASALSGLLGVGVAFLAIPILSFGDQDLVGSIQPLALFLNGVTALFAAFAFATNGLVDWKRALRLAGWMTLAAPLGAVTARQITPSLLWLLFFAAATLVIWLLFKPRRADAPIKAEYILPMSLPVAFLCGVLGVGPGFVMVPLLVGAGFSAKAASGITSVAVVPFSFAALGMHMFAGARIDAALAVNLGSLSAAGALAGGYLASRVAKDRPLRIIFAATIIGLCGYKGLSLTRPHVAPERLAVQCAAISPPRASSGVC
ncbi:MAG: sulfite exporter TauE/SafE family protein [Usitatibacteraceae bacterium]